MSIIFSNCRTCDTKDVTLEELLLKAMICDADGNVYLRTWSPSTTEDPKCGDTDDYPIISRVIDGVSHDGIMFTHGLNTPTLFFTFTDRSGINVTISAQTIDLNTVFIMLDGTEGTFCFHK